MRKKIDVLILVEHKSREFDAACAIAAHAQLRHGLSVEIISTGADRTSKFETFNPAIVVMPWGRFVEINAVPREIINAFPKSVFVDLCYEQLASAAMNSVRAPTGDFAQNQLIHFAWGEFHCEYLRSHGILDERIVLNGNIPLTLYQEPYKHLYTSRADLATAHGLAPGKKWILFAENFFWAFLPDRMIERRYVKKGLSATDAFAFKRYCQDSLRTIVQWIADADDGVEFIFRPRPSVDPKSIREAIARALPIWPDKLKVIKDGSVREWVLASDLVLSSHSTTLLEASFARKPCFAVTPIRFQSPMLAYDWLKLVPHLRTKAEFLAAISEPTHLADPDEQADRVQAHVHTGKDAFAGAADVCARLARGVRQNGREPYYVPEPPITAVDRIRKVEKRIAAILPFKRKRAPQLAEFTGHQAASRVAEIVALLEDGANDSKAATLTACEGITA